MNILALKQYIIAFVFGLVVLVSLPSAFHANNNFNVDRISGNDRYATAVEVSKKGWSNGANTVIITAGNQFPDALTGTPIAYSLNAPILLTNNNSLPSQTKKEITRLKAKKVIILGGENIVSSNVFESLKAMGLTVDRISGADRYETATKIAEALPAKTDTAVVVYGQNFPDSLAIASYAARKGYPIFLTQTDRIPTSTKNALSKYKNKIVVGGTNVISNKVVGELSGAKRYSGADRYSTLANVVSGLNITFGNNVYVATGEGFADALTGSVLAAKENTSIVLVGSSIPSSIQTVLNSANASNATIIGGTSAVSSTVESNLGFNVDALVATAKEYMGTPYRWGGTTPSGFDCSGYLGYVFNKHGISLPRTTSDMWKQGKSVSKLEVGDIVFYRTDDSHNGPSHAGMYIGNNKFIHAKSAGSSTGVTIDDLSNSYFYPRYLGAKRFH